MTTLEPTPATSERVVQHPPKILLKIAATALLIGLPAASFAADQSSMSPLRHKQGDLKPLQCRADELGLNVSRSNGSHRDRSCLIQQKEALSRKWSLVVDARPATAFARGQLPGAVNMTLSQLLISSPLSRQPVLIYEQGVVQADAEVLCARLKSKGMKEARVLVGGYAAWARTQPNTDLLAALEIQATELMAEVASGTPLVAVLGPNYPTDFLGSHVLQIGSVTPAEVVAAIHAYLRKASGSRLSGIILIGDESISNEQWLTWLRDMNTVLPMSFHRATPSALRRSIGDLKALWAKQSQGPAQPKGCSAS